MVFAGVGFDGLNKGILSGVGKVALGDVASVEDGFCAEKAEALEGGAFIVRKVEGDRGLVFVEVGKEAVDEFDMLGCFLVATTSFFNVFFFLAFKGGEVGEDEFSVDDLDIA